MSWTYSFFLLGGEAEDAIMEAVGYRILNINLFFKHDEKVRDKSNKQYLLIHWMDL